MNMNKMSGVDWIGCEQNEHDEMQCTIQLNESSQLGEKRGTLETDRVYFDLSDDEITCTYGNQRGDTSKKQIVCEAT